ncbi:agl14 [Symbiodinium sp. KB8]|nr:agl14 [Symbiodinium sp. KB8]
MESPSVGTAAWAALPGATGYVGQAVLDALLSWSDVTVVAGVRREGADVPEGVRVQVVDLCNAAETAATVGALKPALVVNCAAMSSPRACQEDPTLCKAVNCPVSLLDACLRREDPTWRVPALVHFSTDQVFGGDCPPYFEADAPAPQNVYAASKAAFDALLLKEYPAGRLCILRPTNILGPPSSRGQGGTKFLQWLEGRLAEALDAAHPTPVPLFCDEFRSYVALADVVAAAQFAAAGLLGRAPPGTHATPRLLHVSGPEPLTRVDVARAVLRGLAPGRAAAVERRVLKPTPRASVDTGYPSPLNLSMPPVLLKRCLGRAPVPIAEAVAAQATPKHAPA